MQRNRLRRAACLILAVVAAPVVAQPAAPVPAQLDSVIGAAMHARQMASVAIAVVRDGNVVLARAWGDAKLNDEGAQPATIYFLDSSTKQFTAAAIMLLVQQGRISVDDPVRKYLPAAPANWDGIRIRHLLSHTAGFVRDVRPYAAIPEQNCRPEALLGPLFKLSPQWPPGSKFRYSNAGFNVLAAVIERVTGGCYFELANSRIFEPLSMQRTELALYGAQRRPGHARGYQATPQGIRPAQETPHAIGGGGIASTVLDLAKWDAALRGESILSAASKAQMWAPTTLTTGVISNYGFGWEIAHTAAGKLVHHNGGGFGFNTAIYRYVDAGLTVIVLTNTELAANSDARPKNNGDAIAQRVAALYDTRLPQPKGD